MRKKNALNKSAAKKLIVVLGMHRSGTSAITRGLKVLGVGLGDNLMPPVANDNETGYWEDLDLNALNIEMLSVIGSDWHYLTPIQPDDIEILSKKGYFLRAVELLRQKVSNVPIFGYKDPRMAKLLPFWKGVFSQCQLDLSYVLAIRHPLSVIKSLAKRGGIEVEQSYLLWLGHVIVSLSEIAGENCIIIDYDHLMQAPDFELKRLAKNLDLKIDVTELQNYKTAFLNKELQHTVYDLNDLLLDDACPPLVREIYVALLDVASDKKRVDNLSLQKKVAAWTSEFERLKSPLALVDRLSIKNAAATQAVAERDAQIAGLNQAVNEREGQITGLNQAVAALDQSLQTLTELVAQRDAEVEVRNGQIAGLNQAVNEREGQITGLNQAVAARDQSLQTLTELVAQRDAEVEERNGQIVNFQRRESELQVLSNELRNEIEALQLSTSWQITKPLRVTMKYLCRLISR